MRRYLVLRVAALGATLFGAASCGGHTTDPPSTTPIAAVTTDALFVVNGGDASISVIDPANYVVVGTIRLINGPFPHHLSLSPDRAELALAVPGIDLSGGHDAVGSSGGGHGTGHGEGVKGAVMVLEATTGRTRVARQLDAMNHNAAFSPDGTEIWTSQMLAAGSVLVLDASTLETKRTITVGMLPAEVTFSINGRLAFVANGGSDDVTVIDVASKAVLTTLPVCDGPVGAWPGIDGVMYTDCEPAKEIAAIDAQGVAVTRRYLLGFMPGMVATPPTGTGELWVTDSEHGALVFNTTTADSRTGELVTGGGAHAIGFSSDGQTAFVTNQSAATVSVIDVAGKSVRATVQVGGKPNGLVFRGR